MVVKPFVAFAKLKTLFDIYNFYYLYQKKTKTMARLISVTAYAINSTSFNGAASPMLINADDIVKVTNATLSAKQSVPSASGSINSAIVYNAMYANQNETNSVLVGETLSTLVTASA